jgi:hypothetical protein
MKIRSTVITFRVTPSLARGIKKASRLAGQSVSSFLSTAMAGVLKRGDGARKAAERARPRPVEILAVDIGNHESPIS